MPRLSDTMEEGVIVEWHKKEGDQIAPGDILAEVETDKATMDLESFQEGTLLKIGVKKGDAVPVEGILAVLGEKGEDPEKIIEESKGAEPATEAEDEQPEKAAEAKETAPASDKKEPTAKPIAEPDKGEKIAAAPTPEQVSGTGKRVKASPLARNMAQQKGIELAEVKGTGDHGRIVKRDIENYQPAAKPAETGREEPAFELPTIVGEESSEETRVSQMRKTIAKRLAESKYNAPHFYLTMEIDMSKAVEARKSMNEYSPVKISFNDIITKAAAAAIRQNMDVNVTWLGDRLRYHKHIHIGMAVAIDEGLIVPVIRFADNKSLAHLAAEAKDLGEKARNKELQPEEYQGNTFSISNLGMFGIEEFTAIINPPDSCILAVGAINEKPVIKDGEVTSAHLMKVTLSCDHRAVDGAIGSRFLKTLKDFLEDPVRILI